MGQQILHKAVERNPKIIHSTIGQCSEINSEVYILITNNQVFYLNIIKYDTS